MINEDQCSDVLMAHIVWVKDLRYFKLFVKFWPVEDVVDLAADVGAEAEELAVDPVEDCLQEVSFSGILAVKQLQQL